MSTDAAELQVSRPWGTGWQLVRHARVVQLAGGRARLRFRSAKTVEPAPGEILLLGRGWRELTLDPGSTWRWLVLPGGPHPASMCERLTLPAREHRLLEALLVMLSVSGRPAAGATALALASELVDSGVSDAKADPRIVALIEAVGAQPGCFRSVSTLERASGLSPAHLRRLLVAATGQPPQRWLRGMRMRRAREMLGWGMAVAETALQLGFTDHRALDRQFRAEFGLAPGRLADRIRRPP